MRNAAQVLKLQVHICKIGRVLFTVEWGRVTTIGVALRILGDGPQTFHRLNKHLLHQNQVLAFVLRSVLSTSLFLGAKDHSERSPVSHSCAGLRVPFSFFFSQPTYRNSASPEVLLYLRPCSQQFTYSERLLWATAVQVCFMTGNAESSSQPYATASVYSPFQEETA